MPDDSITDAIGLILNPSEAQDKIPRNNCPFELERHFCGSEIFIGRPDIMQEACKVVRLIVVRPRGEMGFYERCTFSDHIELVMSRTDSNLAEKDTDTDRRRILCDCGCMSAR
jgi:hypothetical protein